MTGAELAHALLTDSCEMHDAERAAECLQCITAAFEEVRVEAFKEAARIAADWAERERDPRCLAPRLALIGDVFTLGALE